MGMGSDERIKRELGHQPRVRYTNGLTIYFANKQATYVSDGKVAIVLERWFDKGSFYQDSWRLLNWRLTRNKNIRTIYDAWKLADRYDVSRHQTFHFPDISKDAIEIKEDSDD